MIRRTLLATAAAAFALLATPAAADQLTITKTATAISDPLGNAFPRTVPAAVVDYKTQANNPVTNAGKPVRNVVIVEAMPAEVSLRVSDLATAGKGPVEFLDGSVLSSGLLSSNLTYTFTSLTSASDSIEFSDGTSWSYQPVADANGYDAKVRAIRVTLTGTFATATAFQLRYRVRIN